MSDYANHLSFLRQVREMGAVRVTMGDVTVEFSGPPEVVDAPDPRPSTEQDDLRALQAWQALQYHSSGG